MKKVFSVGIMVVSFFAVYWFVSSSFHHPSVESELEKTTDKINKRCPIMVDPNTRLDNTETMEKNIIYNYTIIGIRDEDFLRAKDTIRDRVINIARSTRDTKKLLDLGITLRYVYKNENGMELLQFDVQ
jgi:hypothetical protein